MNEEVRDFLKRWKDLLEKGDPEAIASLYSLSAVLMPTFSDKVCSTREDVLDYFRNLMKSGPSCVFEDLNVREVGRAATASGTYAFRLASGGEVKARFTFVMTKEDGGWKIAEHHSSKFPERLWK